VRKVALLGSTGSIGVSALDVLGRLRDRFRVVALAAGGGRLGELARQAREVRPALVAVPGADDATRLRELLAGEPIEVVAGEEGLVRAAAGSGADLVIAAIVGAAGLVPTLAAVRAGLTVALANKEALVAAGEVMTRAARESGATLLPVDSEHNAIHQCLRAGRADEVRRIVLTASGGPFRGRTAGELAAVTPEEALRHPTWEMGPKITIDSATLMNKGLEVIEARWLFGLPPGAIDVVIHPQSVVHSMVEFRDGSIVAQLGTPDMRHPIQYALTYPERLDAPAERLDLLAASPLEFEPPDPETFRCLALAYRALEAGGDAPARLNAANEVAVEAFLAGRIPFDRIPAVLERVLEARPPGPADTLEAVLAADREAREAARRAVARETEGRR